MILDEIVEDKKKRLTCHKKNVSETEIRRAAVSRIWFMVFLHYLH